MSCFDSCDQAADKEHAEELAQQCRLHGTALSEAAKTQATELAAAHGEAAAVCMALAADLEGWSTVKAAEITKLESRHGQALDDVKVRWCGVLACFRLFRLQ